MNDEKKHENNPELEKVDSILQSTVDVMEEGRDEVFKISENSRLEVMNREMELEKTQSLIAYLIGEIEELEKTEKSYKALLSAVKKSPDDFPDKNQDEIFYETEKIRESLYDKRKLEEELKVKRTSLEFYLKNARDVLNRTETLTNKMGSALEFLRGTLVDVIEESKISRHLGVQIIRLQEQERKRVSREIHDGPAQLMANVVMKADYCEKIIERDVDRAKGELKSLKKQVRDSMADIRRIIFDLMPMSLEELGLIPTLTQYIEKIKKSKRINIVFESEKAPNIKLQNLVRLSVFRIVQESLNNVIKHSNSKNAKVKLFIKKNYLDLIIEDSGCGFSQKESRTAEHNSGFGIIGMKERVRLLDGEMDILSIDEGVTGCKIIVNIPLFDKC